jgi:arylsulfatase A-like enzyme
MQPSRRQILKTVGAGIAASAVTSVLRANPPAKRPNIIMLVADDQRGDALGFRGHPDVKTPNLDALAARGTAFTQAYNMGANNGAVCVPARAMIHTGRNLYRAPENMAGVVTLGEALQAAGYDSYAVGKWHNGTPSFTRSFNGGSTIFFGGMTDHLRAPVQDFAPGEKPALRPVHPAGKFDAEAFADAAANFLRKRGEGKREKPFFLYIAFTTPHDPRTPPKEYADLYDAAKISLPANYLPEHPFDNGEMGVRDEKLLPRPLTPEVVRAELRLYYGLITHLDGQVGRILAALKANGEADNTIVIYTGDHGLAIGSHGLLGKQNLYQPSLSTPLIFSGPGIPRDKRSAAIVLKQDYFPTLCEMTGIKAPETVEGQSFAGIFAGKTDVARKGMLSGFKNFQRAYCDGRWKYIRYQVNGKKTIQLFDLQADPAEAKDLSADAGHAPLIERLAGLMRDAQTAQGDTQDFSS